LIAGKRCRIAVTRGKADGGGQAGQRNAGGADRRSGDRNHEQDQQKQRNDGAGAQRTSANAEALRPRP
jgi:hypothetical protein